MYQGIFDDVAAEEFLSLISSPLAPTRSRAPLGQGGGDHSREGRRPTGSGIALTKWGEAGLRPIDARRLRNAAPTEMIRIIREEEPSKPSTRLSTDGSLPSMAALRQTEPRRLMAMLRGELDWVVMKCLEKHRERRYETASGLARDIQRYLADQPG